MLIVSAMCHIRSLFILCPFNLVFPMGTSSLATWPQRNAINASSARI